MRRREFITLLGGAAAWPLASSAQQAAMPVIGFLDARSPGVLESRLRGFHQGLREAGYVDGENATFEFRGADNQLDRLPDLAAGLVRRKVAVIVTSGDHVALVAKAATTTIPIVFIAARDPVALGLVTSLSRPNGNLTGINFFGGELSAKRLELLRAMLPEMARVAVLINPIGPSAETTLSDVKAAASAMGLQTHVLNASTGREIDAAFATLVRERLNALFVGIDPFFTSRRVQLVNMATRHAVPTTFANRDFVEIGGLMSYASSTADAWRQGGAYAGRILKGARPADLPVVQASKFELVINHQTARMFGLTVPQSLIATADEVIE